MAGRIDHGTASPTLPTTTNYNPGTPGYFTEGNPTTGTAATVVSHRWLNGVQEEIISVITAGGLTPSTSTNNQMATAIQTIINNSKAVAATVLPLMNGTAAIGTSTNYARQDHVHASDTSRAPLASPALTGTPTAPTAPMGTNTTQIATTAFVNTASFATSPLSASSSGVKVNIPAASATTTITADEVVVSSSLAGSVYRLGNISKTITLGTIGAGGMDIGTAPNGGFVSVYLIYNPTNSTSALLACNATNSSGPVYTGANQPSGFSHSALVSVLPTNGLSQFDISYQRGREVARGTVQVVAANSVVSATAVSLNSAIPPQALSCSGYAYITSTVSTFGQIAIGSDVLLTGKQIVNGAVGSGNICIAPFCTLIATTQKIYYNSNMGGGTPTFGIYVSGYTF